MPARDTYHNHVRAALGNACAGVFDGPPGLWGRRRQPVSLARTAA